jgi:outer membrane protein OmpA-like peptidoglycan-associated protein
MNRPEIHPYRRNDAVKIHRSVTTPLVAALFVGVLLALTGCSGNPGDGGGTTPAAATALSPDAVDACQEVFARTVPEAAERLVLVVDRTASAADMPLPTGLVDDLRELSLADGSLSIIAVDGAGAAPRIVAKHVAVSTPGQRDRPSVADLAEVIPACAEAVYGAQLMPAAPGTDLHRALALAGELAEPGTTLWLVSDMLGNTGPLTLDGDLLALEADDAARAAAQAAPLDLGGATLEVSGIGNSSTPMLGGHRTWLRDFTAGLCQAWGAQGCDALDLDPVNAERTDTGLPEDPMPPFPGVTSTVTPAGCLFEVPAGVAFAGASATLGPDAVAVLTQPLSLLQHHPTATVTVIGHTASSSAYTYDELVRLSEERAGSVRGFFLANGIDGGRVTARGVGDTEPEVEDIDPSTGRQIAAMASVERRVDILIEGVPCSR